MRALHFPAIAFGAAQITAAIFAAAGEIDAKRLFAMLGSGRS
jgi:hypothetical protein